MAQQRTIVDLQPAGMISSFCASATPTGWLQCNGAAVSRTTYSDLFAAIGTVYGSGDGSTTFNVPEMRGEFLRGWDNARGIDSARAIGTFQESYGIDDSAPQRVNVGFDNNDGPFYYQFTISSSSIQTGASRTVRRYKVRPRNVALLTCIKY
jgi:phage-related tail fiber protein